MISYLIHPTNRFIKDLKLKESKDIRVYKLILRAVDMMSVDLFDSRLKTHKVISSLCGQAYSSRVNGDVRIIWTFENENAIILHAIGGHSGKHKVYN